MRREQWARTIQVLIGAVFAAMAGCETGRPASGEANRRIVTSINDAAIRNAVVRQRTLYPYHFEDDGATPNELGLRELDVLAEHYRRAPGTLNIRKAHTPDPLYEGRVSTVRDLLARAGVDVASMRFEDGMPGGDGRVANEVLSASVDRNNPSRPQYNTGRSSGGSNGGSNGGSMDASYK